MYNREAINILLWKAEMPCLNVWGVSQASQLCDRCHMSPELCTTISCHHTLLISYLVSPLSRYLLIHSCLFPKPTECLCYLVLTAFGMLSGNISCLRFASTRVIRFLVLSS